jgi:8-oxo-dGTP pyrophosphatase MutT (NUDIX family)
MRRRPSSRLLVIDPVNRVLLFRFEYKSGALAGQTYWATPGGALEAGESFESAARRELFEETGILIDIVGQHIAEREFVPQMPYGEQVLAHERFFLVRTADQALSRDRWTPVELQVMTEHKWWSVEELTSTKEVVFPPTLVALLASVTRDGASSIGAG